MPVSYKTILKNQQLDNFIGTYYCGNCIKKLKKIDGKNVCINKECSEFKIQK